MKFACTIEPEGEGNSNLIASTNAEHQVEETNMINIAGHALANKLIFHHTPSMGIILHVLHPLGEPCMTLLVYHDHKLDTFRHIHGHLKVNRRQILV